MFTFAPKSVQTVKDLPWGGLAAAGFPPVPVFFSPLSRLIHGILSLPFCDERGKFHAKETASRRSHARKTEFWCEGRFAGTDPEGLWSASRPVEVRGLPGSQMPIILFFVHFQVVGHAGRRSTGLWRTMRLGGGPTPP